MKIKIIAITEWWEDHQQILGDASHEGDREVESLVEEEKVKKIDENKADGLPFVCEAEDVEDALQQYNDTVCEYDYLKAIECDWEEVDDEEGEAA